MGALLSGLSSPVGGGLFNLGLGFYNDAQLNQWMNQYGDPYNASLDTISESLGPIGNTTQMANQSYNRATGLVGDLSNQNVRDVNQRFDQIGASNIAGLNARGIGGSTVAPSLAYANERNRSDELRRVNDERLNTLLGVESLFGGQQISASQAAADTQLRAMNQRLLFPPGGANFATIQPQRS
jgi:hypothetical protein